MTQLEPRSQIKSRKIRVHFKNVVPALIIKGVYQLEDGTLIPQDLIQDMDVHRRIVMLQEDASIWTVDLQRDKPVITFSYRGTPNASNCDGWTRQDIPLALIEKVVEEETRETIYTGKKI